MQLGRDVLDALARNDTTRISEFLKTIEEEVAIIKNYDIFPIEIVVQEIQDNKDELLMRACEQNKINMVHLILHAGANINCQKPIQFNKDTCLIIAARAGHVNIVKLLLEAGADTTLQTASGYSALHVAALNNQPDVVQLLLQAGTDATLQNDKGDSALHLAATNNNLDVVQLLLQTGANRIQINLQNDKGGTALHYAADAGNDEIIEKLLQAGADIEIRANNHHGLTPLMVAAIHNHKNAAKILMQHGASKEAVDLRGLNALDLAKKHNSVDVIALLEQ